MKSISWRQFRDDPKAITEPVEIRLREPDGSQTLLGTFVPAGWRLAGLDFPLPMTETVRTVETIVPAVEPSRRTSAPPPFRPAPTSVPVRPDPGDSFGQSHAAPKPSAKAAGRGRAPKGD